MKLKYEINTIIKYNKELEKSPYTEGIEAIILGNKCLCICNNKNVFIFNKLYKLIQKMDLISLYTYPKNMIPILNYPNLFALLQDDGIHIYEVQIKKNKEKVILKKRINNPKNYHNKYFSLSCADIIYYFKDNFAIYNIKNESFTYKKFSFSLSTEKKFEKSRNENDIQIIKIIEYKKNELIILLREIIYGEENLNYNCEITIKNSIILFDLEKSEVKKVYITKEDSGVCNTYLSSYTFDYTTFSNDQNIFIIKNSIVYLKDYKIDFIHKINYSIYIINILNGDIKYEFEGDDIMHACRQFLFLFYSFQKSIHLCDNIFLFNGYELMIKKNGIEQNKIDIIYGTNEDIYENDKYYYIKLKKNLFLLYNSHEIKICHFTK